MIARSSQTSNPLGVTVQVSTFGNEAHAMFHVAPRGEDFASQFQRLAEAERQWGQLGKPVMKRYFLSDAANQAPLIPPTDDCSTSLIQQPPLDGSKVALWAYYVKDTQGKMQQGTLTLQRNGYTHLWTMGMTHPQGDSAQQTHALLNQYTLALQAFGANIADNCIRTWFFVRDVDTQYKGLVKARREDFLSYGLNPQTHYIASTGIGGTPANPAAIVQFGAYALTGLQPQQQQYLHASTHLNPTHEYGVTFERGVRIVYGDRSHVFISGTASINNQGRVVHQGDFIAQTHRMWENVGALLNEAQASPQDIAQIIVYLRDTADYTTARQLFEQQFPDIPTVITLAPVCRPAWLIEMECIAITHNGDNRFPPF